VSAAADTPLPQPSALPPPAPPPVLHEVVDPADEAAVEWLCSLLTTGRADLYAQDEADMALLPTLTRTWMLRGEQLRVRAPGTNQKRSVSAAADLGDGGLIWRNDERRCVAQFCATVHSGVERSIARGRLAVFLVDNAPSHRVGKTGWVRRLLNANSGRLVLVFQPKYCPEVQPIERLWRQWRPNVTHNHTRAAMDDLQADSDGWLGRIAADPAAVLQALGVSRDCSVLNMAA
jgi:DDE superfamily endonuclease